MHVCPLTRRKELFRGNQEVIKFLMRKLLPTSWFGGKDDEDTPFGSPRGQIGTLCENSGNGLADHAGVFFRGLERQRDR